MMLETNWDIWKNVWIQRYIYIKKSRYSYICLFNNLLCVCSMGVVVAVIKLKLKIKCSVCKV